MWACRPRKLRFPTAQWRPCHSGAYRDDFGSLRLPKSTCILPQWGSGRESITACGAAMKRTKGVFWFVYSSWLCLLCSSIFLISKEPDYPPPATRTPPLGENTKKHCRSSVFCLNIIRKDYYCTLHPSNT